MCSTSTMSTLDLQGLAPTRRAPHRNLPWLLTILALASALRLAIALQLEHSWYGQSLMPDEATYHGWASALIRGESRDIFSLSPLPAYALAPAYWLFGPHTLVARLLDVALGVALCALTYGIGKEMAGPRAGLLSALLTAVYRPFVFFSGTLLKEPLALLIFSALVHLFLLEYRARRAWRTLLLGAIAGLLLNVRPNAGAVAVILALVLVWRAHGDLARLAVLRCAVLVALGALLTTAPFAVANLRGTGRASPLPLGGFDLYLGNHLDARRPYSSPVAFTSGNPDTQGIEFMIEASRRAGRPMSLSSASDYWTGEVVRAARAEPSRFAWRVAEKALAAINVHEEADNHDLEFARPYLGVLRLPLPSYWLVMPFGLAGLVLAARRSRRAAALLLVVLAYGATMVLVFPNMRIRAPLLVILVPFAVQGLRSTLVQRSLRVRVAFCALALAFAAVGALPLPGTPDLTAQHNLHGGALRGGDDLSGALEEWARSAQLGGVYSDMARISLAAVMADHLEDYPRAHAWLDPVPVESVSGAAKLCVLGRILRKEGRLVEAAQALEGAIAIHAGDPQSRRALISVYRRIAPERVAAAEAELGQVLGVYGPLAPPPFPEDE
jgi:4-amino-4-deoxy-L-arabinose transferase-like glycosyltransferase